MLCNMELVQQLNVFFVIVDRSHFAFGSRVQMNARTGVLVQLLPRVQKTNLILRSCWRQIDASVVIDDVSDLGKDDFDQRGAKPGGSSSQGSGGTLGTRRNTH